MKAYLVEWIDSRGGLDGWNTIDEIIQEAREGDSMLVKSVGFFIEDKKNEDSVIIAQNYDVHTGRIDNVTMIPVVSIRKMVPVGDFSI